MAKKICATPGCRGLGHARGYEHPSHDRFSDCPYAPQNISNDSLKPDRLNSLRGLRRSLSTESENRMEVEDPELGRGNRKRKKRKFFDDDHHHAPVQPERRQLLRLRRLFGLERLYLLLGLNRYTPVITMQSTYHSLPWGHVA